MIEESVRRTEDPILLRGEGRYTDDLNELGSLEASTKVLFTDTKSPSPA